MAQLVIKFHEVFPSVAPRARAAEQAVRPAQKPFGMVLLQIGAPPGVVDDDVQEDAAVFEVRRVGEFAELIHAGRALVKLHENAGSMPAKSRLA